jgi:hypothetical protein
MIVIRQIAGTWVLSWPDGGWSGGFPTCQSALDRVCYFALHMGQRVLVEIGDPR